MHLSLKQKKDVMLAINFCKENTTQRSLSVIAGNFGDAYLVTLKAFDNNSEDYIYLSFEYNNFIDSARCVNSILEYIRGTGITLSLQDYTMEHKHETD